MDELTSLEKQMYFFVQQTNELTEANKSLQNKVTQLEKENEILKLKLEDIEDKVKTGANGSDLFDKDLLNSEEREKLKNRISDLISRLDYHLRS